MVWALVVICFNSSICYLKVFVQVFWLTRATTHKSTLYSFIPSSIGTTGIEKLGCIRHWGDSRPCSHNSTVEDRYS